MRNDPPRSRSIGILLLVAGSGLVVVAIMGLASTLWLGGPDPSLWFIIADGGEGKTISGWTVTFTLVSILAAGISLLALGRRRRLTQLSAQVRS